MLYKQHLKTFCFLYGPSFDSNCFKFLTSSYPLPKTPSVLAIILTGTFIFSFSYVLYHEVEKRSFLKNVSAWFKKLTLATSYLLLSFNES